ncbi:DHH family phosphoesterase [Candidatus Micrarchaeota archaeon]|nr:DHH family phosphoesterase [Candidatus Micrarchaeota archaeon]
MMQLKERFLSFLEGNRDSRFVITSHKNLDLDALCCCYALKSAFPNSTLAYPDKMDSPAKAFAEKLGMEFSELGKLNPSDYDGMLVVDCSTTVLLPEAKKWKVKLVIDHHHPQGEGNGITTPLLLRDEDAPSTAEMLAELLPSVSPEISHVLAVAIISDTARFKSSRASTFSTLASLLEKCGKPYAELLESAEPELELDEKLFVLEMFKKMHISAHGGYSIATVIVPAHESLISSSLSEFSDVVFAAHWNMEEKETRVSSRARKHVPVPLNEVMRGAATELGGGGGGHPKAAGCSSKERPEATLEKCIEVFVRKLDSSQ